MVDDEEKFEGELLQIVNALKYNRHLSKNQHISEATREKAQEAVRLLKLKLYNNVDEPLVVTAGNEVVIPKGSKIKKFL
jgi:hypothetical protein